MTLTVAHISPIMSVIAGVLILIMPRLLNLVIAIFLILDRPDRSRTAADGCICSPDAAFAPCMEPLKVV